LLGIGVLLYIIVKQRQKQPDEPAHILYQKL